MKMKYYKFLLNHFTTQIPLIVIVGLVRISFSGKPSGPFDDYYTSLIGVQNLVTHELDLVSHLVEYREKLLETLSSVENYLDDFTTSISSVLKSSSELNRKYKSTKYPVLKDEDDMEYISEQVSSDPILVFKMLRRFVSELSDIRYVIDEMYHSEFKAYLNDFDYEVQLPTIDDLTGAADGILRLQHTYLLPTNQMANGILMERKTGCGMLASEMQFIGARAVNLEMYAAGLEWLYHAYQKVLQGDDSLPPEVIKTSLLVSRHLHNKELVAFKNLPYNNLFSNLVNSNYSNIPYLFIRPGVTEYPLYLKWDSIYDGNNFNAICRGDQLRTVESLKNLKCWYSTGNLLQNILYPLKIEIHHESPVVYQIYDLLSDKTISHLKTSVLPYLQRSQVIGPRAGEKVKSNVRTSSVAWLSDTNLLDRITSKIPPIVKAATGLECNSEKAAEQLQVSCYGSIGGHYVPHLDALFTKSPPDMSKGDRVATMMFYLSDVQLGGGTAFPRLGVLAKPAKGSAIIWYNLLRNGNPDPLTLHGGCPVLYGNKWVANKWIRLLEQHHVRKCSLNPEE